MDVTPRENFGLGSKLKKFVRKVIPNEIADVAVKAAPFVAPFNPLIAAGMAGLGGFDQSGSLSKSLRSGALTYGLGNLARVVGGAGFQGGLKAPGTGTGFGSYFTSPTSGQQLFGGMTPSTPAVPDSGIDQSLIGQTVPGGDPGVYVEPLNIAEVPTDLSKLKTTDLLKKVVSFDTPLSEKTGAIKQLGGKALKAIYTTDEGKLDKNALFSTIAGVGSYIEAKKIADEAGVGDEYTEEMYEADKAKFAEQYGDLTPEAFGLKEGGRVKLETGGIPSIMLAKKEYNFMDLIDKEGEDEYYEKKAEELDRKYNPERYKQILPKEKPMDKYMLDEVMSERGMNTLSEGTRDDVMKMYAERAYKKGQISEDEYREIMGFKVGGRVGYKVGTTPVYLKDSLFKDKDYLSAMKSTDEIEGILKALLDEKRIPTEKEYKKGVSSYNDARNKIDKFTEKYQDKIDSYDLNKADPKDRFPMEVLILEKMIEDRGNEIDKMDTDVGEMINKMIQYKNDNRVTRKLGSPEKGEEGIVSLDVDMGDDEDNMMMADAPGITFTTSEKSYLFKTLAGQGGSDRSFTMPQLYGILNNPNSDKNIEDAKALKAFLKMKGFKTGGRVKLKDGYSPEIVKKAREKWNSVYGKDKWGEEILVKDLYSGGFDEFLDIFTGEAYEKKAYGGRVQYAMGSEVPVRENQAGVSEMEFRETGGFVPPIGVKEKADDIPAMLSNNEFVFTADAVRAAGGGSVNKGAQKMYTLMKQLEGKVI